jgi:hypothetical protein
VGGSSCFMILIEVAFSLSWEYNHDQSLEQITVTTKEESLLVFSSPILLLKVCPLINFYCPHESSMKITILNV